MRWKLLSRTAKQTTKNLNKIQARILNISLATIIGFSGLFSAVPFLFPASAAAATLDVCASGCTYTSIQAAIAAASPSDTITVGAGTYTEQIVIDKNLTITGTAGRDATTIQAPGTLANDPDGAKTIVLVTGSISAEISGFTIQGPVSGLNFGIYVRAGATANIHNNTVKDINDGPLSGAQRGYGIEVGKYNNTEPFVNQVGHATIANNTVIGYQKTGIEVEGTGSSGTITGNTVTGAGLITTTSQNGIQIRRGATGSIINNTVTGNAYTGHEVNATGITVTYPGDNVIVQGNIVNHNTANIYTYQANGIQILNNQVSDAADGRVVAGITADSDDVATASVGITVTITGNSVKNNLSGGSHQGPGIFLWGVKSGTISENEIAGSGDDGILIGASGNIGITNNLFSGNGFNSFLSVDPNAAAIDFGGIIPELESYGLQPNTLGGFTVHNNSFTGNRNAIWNYDTGNVDATRNYWGSASPSFASIIGGTVTHDPWYTNTGRTTLSNATVTDATYTSPTDGQADLPSGVTDVVLDNTHNLDVSGGVNSVSGGNVTAGGVVQDLTDYTGGDLGAGVNLDTAQTVGGQLVTVGMAVTLQSGTNTQPIVLTNTDLTNVSASIPDGTTVLAPTGWDGKISPPKAGSSSGIAPSGFSVGGTVIEVGSPGTIYFFSIKL